MKFHKFLKIIKFCEIVNINRDRNLYMGLTYSDKTIRQGCEMFEDATVLYIMLGEKVMTLYLLSTVTIYG